LFILPLFADAQKDITKECVPTFMFQATYAYQFPGADTKILYGNNSSVGASFMYKTDKNWFFAANGKPLHITPRNPFPMISVVLVMRMKQEGSTCLAYCLSRTAWERFTAVSNTVLSSWVKAPSPSMRVAPR